MNTKNHWLLLLAAPLLIACGGGSAATGDSNSVSGDSSSSSYNKENESSEENQNNTDSQSNDESQNNEGSGTGSSTTTYPSASNFKYVLTAWNDLGMHCMDGNDFSVFSVLPPYNNLHAQIKDKNGDLITSGITLTYQAAKGTDGKWNTSSTDKTNF